MSGEIVSGFFEVGYAGGCTEGGIARCGIATSAGDTCVELEDIFVNASVNGRSSNLASTSRSWLCLLLVIQNFGLVFGCLHARDHQGNVVAGCTLDVSHILDEI